MIKVTSNFDSGNIEVISARAPHDIRLNIRHDNQSEFYQWFHFRLSTTEPGEHRIRIENCAGSAYPKGWEGYQAVASYDRETWFRVDTHFDGQALEIRHIPEHNSIYFAYFAPYSYERHQDLLHEAQTSPLCELHELGETLDGRDLSMLQVGEPGDDKKNIWIIARQHPGESMAEWFIEGLLERLLDQDDAVAKKLLQQAVFYIVPNMNPDGSVRGHLRTNAVGANLNREWLEPTLERSPEVYWVRAKMLETGVDMFLDIHGDENLPYNFVAGSEGVPAFTEHMNDLQERFKAAWLMASPDFQTTYGYPLDAPGEANMTLATSWVSNQFTCLGYTVEMPFKDNNDLPDELYGWSDVRAAQFGRDVLPAVLAVVKDL